MGTRKFRYGIRVTGDEMVYMMTEHDEVKILRAENAKLIEACKAALPVYRPGYDG